MNDVVSEDMKKLVLARLETMPEHMKMSMGNTGSFNKAQLIEEVKNETPVGEQIIKMHLMYLRSFKK